MSYAQTSSVDARCAVYWMTKETDSHACSREGTAWHARLDLRMDGLGQKAPPQRTAPPAYVNQQRFSSRARGRLLPMGMPVLEASGGILH